MFKKTTLLVVTTLMLLGSVYGWSAEKTLTGTLNINTASQTELMMLPGIGATKAQKIIETRTQKPFSKKEDVLGVVGIGEKLLAKITPYIAFDGKSSLAEGSGHTESVSKSSTPSSR